MQITDIQCVCIVITLVKIFFSSVYIIITMCVIKNRKVVTLPLYFSF